jgi:hypothetical protein
MYLDGKLTWKNHVERTVKKTKKKLNFLKRLALGSDFLLQLADQDLALLREQFHEALQDREVEE